MKITPTQRLIAVAVLLALAAVAFVVLVILPEFAAIDSMNAELNAAQARVQQAQAQLTQLRVAKARAAQTDAQVLQLATEMPDSPQLPTLIIELQDIAAASGVDVISMAPAQPVPASSGLYTEIPVNLQLDTNWDDLLDYLRRIDRATRLLRISTISIVPGTQRGSATPAELTANIQVKAYETGSNGTLAPSTSTSSTPTTGTP